MEIESEFILNGLEYSYILHKKYTWNELKERDFKFDSWRVPTRTELINLFDCIKESRDGSYIWSSSDCSDRNGDAWLVFFNLNVSGLHMRSGYCNVRLVRRMYSE